MEGTTILVTGASGLLGRAVMEELSGQTAATVVGLAYSRAGGPHGLLKVDLTDAAALAALLAERRPDVIVHCAAERQPDVCEHDDARTVALNVSLVEQLAAAAEGSPGSGSASSGSGSGCWMVALSTDYVFDGRAPPFATDAPTRPLNKYGESKAAGERAFRAVHPRGALLRCCACRCCSGPRPTWASRRPPSSPRTCARRGRRGGRLRRWTTGAFATRHSRRMSLW